jgi:hypothetical protein
MFVWQEGFYFCRLFRQRSLQTFDPLLLYSYFTQIRINARGLSNLLCQGKCSLPRAAFSVVIVEGCSLTFSFFSAVVVRPILWSLCPTKNAAVVFFVAATVLVAVIIFVDSVVVLLATQSLFLRSNRSPRTPHPL